MGLVVWLLLGIIVGAALYSRKKTIKGGLTGALFLGILGAIEGGYASSFVFGTNSPSLQSYLLAFFGAVFLLGIQQLFTAVTVN